jgi:hypothetical protein
MHLNWLWRSSDDKSANGGLGPPSQINRPDLVRKTNILFLHRTPIDFAIAVAIGVAMGIARVL